MGRPRDPGTLVNGGWGASLTEGAIQSEGAEVYVRQFELKPLSPEIE